MSDIEYSVITSDVIKSFDCINHFPSNIMKFLTWVSIKFVLSVIPNVTYFKLKLIVMLCLDKNMVRFVHKCCIWLHSPKKTIYSFYFN